MAEAFQILTRQPRNQVQMLMDVMPFIDCAGNTAYLVYVSLAAYGLKRVRIGGLDANLQLDQSGTHLAQKLHFLLVQQISGNLKMKISDSVVLTLYKLPNGHGMFFIAVKGPVHKFHLRDPGIQEITEFFPHQSQIAEPHLPVYG
jgi:hypothetical protein